MAPQGIPSVGHVAVDADVQLQPVAAEHEAIENDIAGLGGGSGEEAGKGARRRARRRVHSTGVFVETRARVPASPRVGQNVFETR